MASRQDLVELRKIVGDDNVSDDPEMLDLYSNDYSFVSPRKPRMVVKVRSVDEVQEVVKYANEQLIAVTPRSSKISFYGAGIPSQGGMILDLTNMNKILKVDSEDRYVRIEPGVTWPQIQDELEKVGLMVCNPLFPHPDKSVLTSCMEREPMLIPKDEYDETLLTAEMVLANGELFYTGTAVALGEEGRSHPEAFLPSNRIFIGAQGTFGVMTWATLKAVNLPVMNKIFFVPFNKFEDLTQLVYRVQWRMMGNECFALNDFNLAAVLAEDINNFEILREELPDWTLILCLSAQVDRFPEEKIAYEEEALKEIAISFRADLMPSLPGIPGLDKSFLPLLRKAWPKETYWKHLYKGSCQGVFFDTTMDRVPLFTKAMNELASRYRYPATDIGFYFQPKSRGRMCHCEYTFHYDKEESKEVEKIRGMHLEASEMVLGLGGLFSTPYGSLSDMVYSRDAVGTSVLRVIKNAFDANNIMNPGKLCF